MCGEDEDTYWLCPNRWACLDRLGSDDPWWGGRPPRPDATDLQVKRLVDFKFFDKPQFPVTVIANIASNFQTWEEPGHLATLG